MKHLSLLFLLICSLSVSPYAQNFKVYDNKDSLKAYLLLPNHSIDPEASAVILYETAISETIGGIISYKYEIAYKVFNTKKIGDLADIAIPKFKSGTIRKLKGTTFNYEHNEIVESKIEKGDIIFDTYADNVQLVKFSMPAIKNGSVVTYSYTYEEGSIPSSWQFQKSFPVLYSRFEFNIPTSFIATPMMNSTVAFKKFETIKKMKASDCNACYGEEALSYGNITLRNWVRRNIPAFKEEALMGSKQQYLERVKVHINGISSKGIFYPNIETWDKFSKESWYDRWLSQPFQKNNFLNDTVESLISKTTDSIERAKILFYYVQKNIQTKIKEEDINRVFERRQGSALGINKLLCAMLRNGGFNSDLIVLSNKENDKLSEVIPNPEDATNIVVRVVINNISYLLDAGQKELPFGYLPSNYYNGYARIVNKEGGSIDLSPAFVSNATVNTVYISASKEKNSHLFKFKQIKELGVYSGASIRSIWKSDSVAIKKRLSDMSHGESSSIGLKIEQVQVDNIEDIDKKIRIRLEGYIDFGQETDVIFLDPYFEKVLNENPVKEVKNRKYPIEFDYLEQNNYKIYIMLNDQYEFDDYPTAKHVAFGDPAQISFKSTVDLDTTQNKILLQSRFENGSISLPVAEVEELRNFYNDIIKSQSQKVVLKRRKNNHVEN